MTLARVIGDISSLSGFTTKVNGIANVKILKKFFFQGIALLVISFNSALVKADVTYIHTDQLGSVIAKSDEHGNILARYHYTPFGEVDSGKELNDSNSFTGHVHDDDINLIYMQARYYDPVIGRFYSNDPVDALGHMQRGNSIAHGFNRYAYANNNPYKYTDPDGKFVFLTPFVPAAATALGKALVFVGTATLAGYAGSEAINAYNESAEPAAPDVPNGLVGDQSDDRAGPNKSGKRHTSGPLTPENGGTGDYETDLETLTGGTRPAGEGDSAPPGSQVGENGIFGRPENSTGGASIDIPAKGDKPHETLHYDKK